LEKLDPLSRMQRPAAAFLEFLADCEPSERAAVALEFVAGFMRNVGFAEGQIELIGLEWNLTGRIFEGR